MATIIQLSLKWNLAMGKINNFDTHTAPLIILYWDDTTTQRKGLGQLALSILMRLKFAHSLIDTKQMLHCLPWLYLHYGLSSRSNIYVFHQHEKDAEFTTFVGSERFEMSLSSRIPKGDGHILVISCTKFCS